MAQQGDTGEYELTEDEQGQRIASAIALFEQVLDDLGWVISLIAALADSAV